MGQHNHNHNHHERQYQHHPAVDGLLSLFIKAHHDLSLVHLKLDKEFHQIYPDNANPMKLVGRIKKIQDELSSIKDQCRELLTAKQELIDKASSILVGNRSMLQRMEASVGIPVSSDSEDAAYSSFNEVVFLPSGVWRLYATCQQATEIKSVINGKVLTVTASSEHPLGSSEIIEEWTAHVRSGQGTEEDETAREYINNLLFASIVGST